MRFAYCIGSGIMLGWFCVSASVWAVNTQSLRPSTGAVRGFHLFTSDLLPPDATAYGVHFNFDRQPFEIATVSAGSRRQQGIVDAFLTSDFVFTLGANPRLNISIGLPVNLYHNVAPTIVPSRDTGGGDIGDLWLNGKVRILDADTTPSHVGLAIVPYLTVPTGRESIHFGDQSVTGGGWIAGDWQWRKNRLYLNLGTRLRHVREAIVDLTFSHEFLYGIGFHRPLIPRWRTEITAEVYGSTRYEAFFHEHGTTPVEVLVVAQKKCIGHRPVIAHVGGGAGLTAGYSTSDFRALVGITYVHGMDNICQPVERPVKAESPAPQFIRLKEKIHFYTASAKIMPQSYPTLDEVVRILQNHPEVRKVQIEGHTDSRADDAYNQRLSESRAKAVADYLVAKGIEAKRLIWIGYGETRPIATNETVEGRAMNRRTVLRIVEVDEALQPKRGTKDRLEEGDTEFRKDEALYPDR
ncbi:MAG: OmpA family protein [Deltaproteobacteria bacterium]|nr:OmpA family protein [Deltaproteobacteria bacterium]